MPSEEKEGKGGNGKRRLPRATGRNCLVGTVRATGLEDARNSEKEEEDGEGGVRRGQEWIQVLIRKTGRESGGVRLLVLRVSHLLEGVADLADGAL